MKQQKELLVLANVRDLVDGRDLKELSDEELREVAKILAKLMLEE